MATLTPAQFGQFQAEGFIRLPGLLETRHALQLQAEIWNELEEEFGIKQTDRNTWRTPPRSPKKAKFSSANTSLINDSFRLVIDHLLGRGNWTEPNAWGGFLITFPDKDGNRWHLADKLWHWDYELFRGPELKGLLIFSFYSEVKPRGGGTLVVKGSHRALHQYDLQMTSAQRAMKHGEQRKDFMRTHPYFRELIEVKPSDQGHVENFMQQESVVDGVPLQVLELTGEPGDVVFCHPRLVHAPAAINLATEPRFMRTKFLW